MTDEEMAAYLRENGYPEHVVRAGRAGLIERWGKFVAEVERGYQFGLEDYRNDLDLRGIIAMLGLDAEVSDLDRRFEALLIHRDKRVWESSAADPFWDFGYPRMPASSSWKILKMKDLYLTSPNLNRHWVDCLCYYCYTLRCRSSAIFALLEAESIHIMREVASEFQRPVMLYSIGKDSSVLLRLAQKAFHPAPIPFPLLHIDTTYKFREMIEFRDRYTAEIGAKLIVYTNREAIDDGANPFRLGTQRCCGLLKTKALLDGLRAGRLRRGDRRGPAR